MKAFALVIALAALPNGIDPIEESVRGTGLDPADVEILEDSNGEPFLGFSDDWVEECTDLVVANLRRAGFKEATIVDGPDIGLDPDDDDALPEDAAMMSYMNI